MFLAALPRDIRREIVVMWLDFAAAMKLAATCRHARAEILGIIMQYKRGILYATWDDDDYKAALAFAAGFKYVCCTIKNIPIDDNICRKLIKAPIGQVIRIEKSEYIIPLHIITFRDIDIICSFCARAYLFTGNIIFRKQCNSKIKKYEICHHTTCEWTRDCRVCLYPSCDLFIRHILCTMQGCTRIAHWKNCTCVIYSNSSAMRSRYNTCCAHISP